MQVELIGDCYLALVGGPHPCTDHADRAAALAVAMQVLPLRARTPAHVHMMAPTTCVPACHASIYLHEERSLCALARLPLREGV